MGIFSRYVGDSAKDFARGWTRQVVNVLDWDINDVFNDGTTQEVNNAVMTRVDLAIDYYNTNLKVEPLANGDTDEKNRSGISNIIDNPTVMMSNAHRRKRICAHE